MDKGENLRELICDLFAGGGGASEGIRLALGRDPDVAINHDRVAVAMHLANHPGTRHLRQDIWEVSPKWATRRRPVGLLWASPDCKFFSKAKGGALVRSREIRSLAWVVERWAREVRPRVIILENVEEFKSWGPLDKDGIVIVSQKGTTFIAFIRSLRRLGYVVEWRELRACDYGAPTIRKRLFIIARCDGYPIVWPEPTHGPGRTPYRTAAEIIDWSIPCPSIFERKKPLAENTLKRIARGIKKFVVEAAEPFIITYYGPKGPNEFRGSGIHDPVATQTTENRFGLVEPFIVPLTHQGGDRVYSTAEPLRTVTAAHRGEMALISPHIQRQFGQGIGGGVDSPVGTITAGGMGKTALVGATLIQTGYGERPGQAPRVPGLDKPLGTVVAGGNKHALVTAFMAQHNGGFYDGAGHSIDKPISTITHRGTQQQIVTSNLIKLRGTSKSGQAVTAPAPTITAGGLHIAEVRAFLIKYYGTALGQLMTDPTATVTTRDKMALITVMIKDEPYIIADIGMRMLSPRELFRAQGFSDEYRIDIDVGGKRITKTDQVRCCGNSVCPPLARALVEANFEEMVNRMDWTYRTNRIQ